MTAFRRARAHKLEFAYYRGSGSAMNEELAAKYRCILDNALPKECRHYLKEYTACLIELYCKDASYFYDWCFDDCQQLYAKLFGIKTLCRIDSPSGIDYDGDKDLFDMVAGVLGGCMLDSDKVPGNGGQLAAFMAAIRQASAAGQDMAAPSSGESVPPDGENGAAANEKE